MRGFPGKRVIPNRCPLIAVRSILTAVHRTGYTLIVLSLLIVQVASAQTVRPQSDNYRMPSDVQPVGGGEAAKSTFYILDDTIGEANIGPSRSDTFALDAGYRQTVAPAYIAMNCTDGIDIGEITLTGQATGSGSCTIVTDADAGYALTWGVLTGSGGTHTGYLISQNEDVIAPFAPAVAGTPDDWSVAQNDARWGGRLSSDSTDTDAQWGTDDASEKWLNVGTGSYTVVSRSSRTDDDGSEQIIQFRVEIGAQKIQSSGLYTSSVVLTASAL